MADIHDTRDLPPPPSARAVGPVGEVTFRISDELSEAATDATAKAESIGALRTHLLSQHLREGRRSLTLCAPDAGVGCTSLAVKLAVGLAEVGAKTLLIDADMRHPMVHRFITPSREVPGLQQCLADETVSFGDGIHGNVLSNLSVMYAGGRSPRAQELLAGPRFRDLVESCLRDFDITIIDTPPANSCADARRIASVAGYAMIVVGRNRTFVADVKTLATELQADRAKVIGTVLNET